MNLRPFALERFFAQHEFSVKYLACASDPQSMSVSELLALEPGAADAFAALHLGYTETTGHPELRAQITRLYQRTSPEQVLVCAGAEEPIFAFMNVALGPGAHAIVHAPSYQSLYEVARATGAEVSLWQARETDRWQLDPDELPSLLRPGTRVIVINSPHNPTGALLDPERLTAIVAFARKHGLWLFSDEAYRGLEHLRSHRNPAVADLYERGVSLGAMAKTYGLAGLRIGWLASPHARLLEQVAAFKDYTTICSAAPSEFLATVALRHADALADRARAQVLSNKALFAAEIHRPGSPFSWVEPQAGTTAFPRLAEGSSASRFCEELLQATGVLLMPGRQMDADDQHVRMGLGRADFPAAMQALQAHLTR